MVFYINLCNMGTLQFGQYRNKPVQLTLQAKNFFNYFVENLEGASEIPEIDTVHTSD